MRINAGQYKGRSIKTCEGPGYRPATGKVRGAVFSMLEARGIYWPETRLVDMFAGSGSLGIEALSRGAEVAWFVEKANKAAGLIRQNLKELKVEGERWKVLNKDLFTVLSGPPPKPFNLGFIDPPYGKNMLGKTLEKALASGWYADDAIILAEIEVQAEIPSGVVFDVLQPLVNKEYGQTRILLWQNRAGG